MRYPLHLPVLLRTARKETRARSENISLGGILLASDILIPEGTQVEVAVGVEHTPDPGILLSARGKVLRVQPKDTGDFALAILLERAFELPVAGRELRRAAAASGTQSASQEKSPVESPEKTRTITYPQRSVASWFNET